MSGKTGETTLLIYKVHSFARHSSFYRSLNFCFDTGIWSKITKILLKIRTARIIWISFRLLQEKNNCTEENFRRRNSFNFSRTRLLIAAC